jgi:hypothetical protein
LRSRTNPSFSSVDRAPLKRKPGPASSGFALYLVAAEMCDQLERRRGDALRRCPLPTRLQAIRQSGKVVTLFS